MIFRHLLNMRSHPTWVRGLKLRSNRNRKRFFWSHPTWVRGLKPISAQGGSLNDLSHPTWVRGLKPESKHALLRGLSRTPRGCVD